MYLLFSEILIFTLCCPILSVIILVIDKSVSPFRGRQILLITRMITDFITPILKSLVVPVIWFALIGAIYSRITQFFALNWPNPVFGRFKNGCNKVAIESRVVQFWSEIILVISNWTRIARSFDFEITCMILAQIALHSVKLPLRIGLHSVLLPLLIS